MDCTIADVQQVAFIIWDIIHCFWASAGFIKEWVNSVRPHCVNSNLNVLIKIVSASQKKKKTNTWHNITINPPVDQ